MWRVRRGQLLLGLVRCVEGTVSTEGPVKSRREHWGHSHPPPALQSFGTFISCLLTRPFSLFYPSASLVMEQMRDLKYKEPIHTSRFNRKGPCQAWHLKGNQARHPPPCPEPLGYFLAHMPGNLALCCPKSSPMPDMPCTQALS